MMPPSKEYFYNNGRRYEKTPAYLERKRMNQAAYRERQQKANLLAVTCYIHQDNAEKLRHFASTLVAPPKNKNKTARK